MKPDKSPSGDNCRVVIDKNLQKVNGYDCAEVTSKGKYRCRDCGVLFDTPEEHEVHQRKIH